MIVSVIITCYNYAHYLEEAIRSCLTQSLSESAYEIVVVNDGGSDDANRILEPFKNKVRLFHLPENAGVAAARNFGVKQAKGSYVVFLDADDCIHPDLLYVQHLHLKENPKLDAVSVDYHLMDEHGNHLQHLHAPDRPIACGIMFRKELLLDVGLYDEAFRAREEEDLRIRFTKKYSIHNIPLPLYRYRRHKNNLTNNRDLMETFYHQLQEKHG